MTIFWVGLIATAVVGIGTYLIRASFIVALADMEMPPAIRVALGYVAPAVLAALVVSLLLGGEDTSVGWQELVALVVGGVVGWKTRSLPWVLAAGMATLWLLQWIA